MDEENETPRRRPSISQLSKTPSWVMLGFLLGAAFVWTLRPPPPPPRPILVAPTPEKPRVREQPQLTTIETLFQEWSQYVVWDDHRTQIAVWNPGMGDFTDFYEVRRINGADYFRSIPHLTNRIVRHGKAPPTECPILFTETEAQYQEWRNEDRYERPAEPRGPMINVPRVEAPARPKPMVQLAPLAPSNAPAIDPTKPEPKR